MDNGHLTNGLSGQLPMGIGHPDVAHAVVFLTSPLAKFITGAALDIGGTIRGLV